MEASAFSFSVYFKALRTYGVQCLARNLLQNFITKEAKSEPKEKPEPEPELELIKEEKEKKNKREIKVTRKRIFVILLIKRKILKLH